MLEVNNDIPEIQELVINWHITEACNYRCRYCYASWKSADARAELWRYDMQSGHLLEVLHSFFAPSNLSNPLRERLRWRSLRLSLAGGEPALLGGRLVDIAAEARMLGFNISLITNGSRKDTLADVAKNLDMLGISIDSINQHTNKGIGRVSTNGMRVSLDDIVAMVRHARSFHPRTAIKINTVVNAMNAGEDMSELILKIRPDRWKVMRMLPTVTNALSVGVRTFQSFVDRHQDLCSLMTVEDNTDMVQSYIMVDPFGRFFQNQSDQHGYLYSRPILESGAELAFREIKFCPTTFAARYSSDQHR